MPKQRNDKGDKNFIAPQLLALRRYRELSQRDLARELQLIGYDIDRNVITRIESYQRYVTDIELKAFSEIFSISYTYLIEGVMSEEDKIKHPTL